MGGLVATPTAGASSEERARAGHVGWAAPAGAGRDVPVTAGALAENTRPRCGPCTYSPSSQVIAIASGKGGVGKSNLAASLSILLSASGARVALVDADVGLGNLDVLLGVSPARTLADVAAGRKSLEEVLLKLPCGVHLAAGASGPADGTASRPLAGSVLPEGVGRLRSSYDFVILDCGSGIGPQVTDLCFPADQVLVVTSPEPTAMTDAYGMIKSLSAHGFPGRVSVLVNFASGQEEARACHARLSSVAGQFLGRTIYDAGYVLMDPKVPLAVRRRRPFVLAYPRCPASRCLIALASKLCRGSPLLNARKTGLVRRFAGWVR